MQPAGMTLYPNSLQLDALSNYFRTCQIVFKTTSLRSFPQKNNTFLKNSNIYLFYYFFIDLNTTLDIKAFNYLFINLNGNNNWSSVC